MKMSSHNLPVVVAIMFFACANTLARNGNFGCWVASGLGLGRFNGESGVVQYGDVGLLFNRKILCNIRIIGLDERANGENLNKNQILDGGLLVGYSYDTYLRVRFNVSGGISFIYADKYESVKNVINNNEYDRNIYHTIGFPLNLEIMFTVLKNVGLGISGVANLNAPSSYIGLLASLKVGKLL